jgi:hypothetical protein
MTLNDFPQVNRLNEPRICSSDKIKKLIVASPIAIRKNSTLLREHCDAGFKTTKEEDVFTRHTRGLNYRRRFV